jgi:hypothetical protein
LLKETLHTQEVEMASPVWRFMSIVPATPTWEAEERGLRIKASPGKNTRLCLENKLQTKRTRSIDQVVEQFLSKLKALSSIPRTAKIQKKQKKKTTKKPHFNNSYL